MLNEQLLNRIKEDADTFFTNLYANYLNCYESGEIIDALHKYHSIKKNKFEEEYKKGNIRSSYFSNEFLEKEEESNDD